MKITINGQEKDLISFIKDEMKLKSITIGITITPEIETINGDQKTVEPASFTMVLATPDNNWTKPMFITGHITKASELISISLSSPPQPKVVKVTNADEVERVAEPTAKVKTANQEKHGGPGKTKEVKVPKIDWTITEKYIASKDWAKARYDVNQTLRTKWAKDKEAIVLIDTKLKEIEELSKPVELFEGTIEALNELTIESTKLPIEGEVFQDDKESTKVEDTNEPTDLEQ